MTDFLKHVAETCLEACRNRTMNACVPDDMWRGRGIQFFSAVIDLCETTDLHEDLSLMFDLKRLRAYCESKGKLWDYLVNLPGFCMSEDISPAAFAQHYRLMELFTPIINSECLYKANPELGRDNLGHMEINRSR